MDADSVSSEDIKGEGSTRNRDGQEQKKSKRSSSSTFSFSGTLSRISSTGSNGSYTLMRTTSRSLSKIKDSIGSIFGYFSAGTSDSSRTSTASLKAINSDKSGLTTLETLETQISKSGVNNEIGSPVLRKSSVLSTESTGSLDSAEWLARKRPFCFYPDPMDEPGAVEEHAQPLPPDSIYYKDPDFKDMVNQRNPRLKQLKSLNL